MNIRSHNPKNYSSYGHIDTVYHKTTPLRQTRNEAYNTRNGPKVTYFYKTETFVPITQQSRTIENNSANRNRALNIFNRTRFKNRSPQLNKNNNNSSRIYVTLPDRKNNYYEHYHKSKYPFQKTGKLINKSYQENNGADIYGKRVSGQNSDYKTIIEKLKSKKINENNNMNKSNTVNSFKYNTNNSLEEKSGLIHKAKKLSKITDYQNKELSFNDKPKNIEGNTYNVLKKKPPIYKKIEKKTNIMLNYISVAKRPIRKPKIYVNISNFIKLLSPIFIRHKKFYWQEFKDKTFKIIKVKKLIYKKKQSMKEGPSVSSRIKKFDPSTENLLIVHPAENLEIEGDKKPFIKMNKINQINNNKLTEKNKELEDKLKEITEENINLKENQNNYNEILNKYNDMVKNQNKNAIDINNELLLKYIEIQNKTNHLLLENQSLYDVIRKNKLKTDSDYNKFVKVFNSLSFNVKLRVLYLKYLFCEKIGKEKKLVKIYFDMYKDKMKILRELEKEHYERLKRNKQLRDLFYNKIRERQAWIHKYFTKFYFKGLLSSMKNQNSNSKKEETAPKKEEVVNENKINEDNNNINNNSENKINNNENNNENNNINENNNNEINNNPSESQNIIVQNKEKETEKPFENSEKTEKKNENNNTIENTIKEEKKPEENNVTEEKKAANLNRAKSRNLRKLLSQRSIQRLEMIRKAFYTFQCNGYLSSLKKMAKRASRISEKDLQKVSEIIKEENENQEKAEKKEEEERMEKERIEKEKIEKEKNELNQKRIEKIRAIVFKKDREVTIALKRIIENWNLRTKIISLNDLGVVKTKKKTKKVKKGKKKQKENKDENIENKEDDVNNKNEENENNN